MVAIIKQNSILNEEQELVAFAKALAHPARIAILKKLSEHGTCICGEIVEVLPLAQSTVSQHLKELQNAGLIKGTIEGVKSCYCIDEDNLERLNNLLNTELKQLIKNNKKHTKCC